MLSIVSLALRGFQFIFATVVVGLSASLIKGQAVDLPATLGYGAFVGAVSMVGACVGMASTWIEFLEGIVMAAVDGVVLIFNLAGGIVFAYKLRGLKCGDNSVRSLDKMVRNELINGGCIKRICRYDYHYDPNGVSNLTKRCKQNQTDYIFMFITAAFIITCAVVHWLILKRK